MALNHIKRFLKRFNLFYLVTLLFILLSARANALSCNNEYWGLIMLFMVVVGVFKKLFTLRDLRTYGVFTLIYLACSFFRSNLNNLDVKYFLFDVTFLLKYISLAFLYCCVLKYRAISYIAKVVTDLALISIFFFAAQLLARDTLYNAMRSLKLPNDSLLPGFANIVIFSIQTGSHDNANSGFTWEPGAFGCFLNIALLFQLYLNKFKFNTRAFILVAAIITTFSTTAYLGL